MIRVIGVGLALGLVIAGPGAATPADAFLLAGALIVWVLLTFVLEDPPGRAV